MATLPAGFELEQQAQGDLTLPQGFEIERARQLGAVPGVAITPEQQAQIQRGETIQPEQPTLPGREFRPVAETKFEDPLLRSAEQGLVNVGGGILRGLGELSNLVGVEGANQFLQELLTSQAMEQEKTGQIAAETPITKFVGEVAGETLGFPVGGGGGSLLSRIVTGMAAGGTAGGLSAAGRGKAGADIATEAGIGAALAPATEGISALRKARRAAKEAKEVGGVAAERTAIEEAAEQVTEGELAQQATGIRLLPAQKTLDPFQLETQSFIGQNPEVSKKAFRVLKNQNKEAATAVDSLLNVIAAPQQTLLAAPRARTAAGNIINSKALARTEAASPIFKQAFRRQRQGKVPLLDTEALEIKISAMANQFDETGQVSKKLSETLDKISRSEGNLSRLHNSKLEIDQIIEARGENAIGRTTKRFLTDVQTDLVALMEKQSPSYRAARDEFKRLSPAVDDIRNGVFGRISDIKDLDLKRVSGIIFDPDQPASIATNAIKSLKNVEGGEEIASGLVRNELEKRLGRMKTVLAEGAETGGRKLENLPQQLLTNFFGNAKQKKVLFNALTELNPGALQNAKWLEKSLDRASAGRPGGSQTGIRQVITQQLRGVSLAIRDLFRRPIESLVGLGEDAIFSRKVQALGDTLYDPTWKADMDKIRKLNPNSRIAQSKFERLLQNVINVNESIRTTTQAAVTAERKSLLGEEQQ